MAFCLFWVILLTIKYEVAVYKQAMLQAMGGKVFNNLLDSYVFNLDQQEGAIFPKAENV